MIRKPLSLSTKTNAPRLTFAQPVRRILKRQSELLALKRSSDHNSKEIKQQIVVTARLDSSALSRLLYQRSAQEDLTVQLALNSLYLALQVLSEPQKV